MPVLYAERALTPEGWKSDVRVTVDAGVIATVETEAAAQEEDERHAIMAPAAANLHSHAFQRAMAGLAEVRGTGNDTFWTWRETMYRFALMMSPDDVEAVAAQLYVEMLEAGFAAVAEFHYLHNAPDGSPYAEPAEMAGRILSAARRVGIGMTLLPVFYAHSTFGGAPPRPEQRRFICDLPSFARLVDDCREMIKVDEGEAIGIAPHSLRAVTPSEMSELLSVADGDPIHIHAAEQVKEVDDCVASLGARPVRWLLDHGGLDEKWCLIHATHMDERETHDLARSGAVAGLCPITEGNLGDGSSTRRITSPPADATASARIPTSRLASPRNCASSNIREAAREGEKRLRAARRVVGPDNARHDLVGRRPGAAAKVRQARAWRGRRHSHLSRRPSHARRQSRRSNSRRVGVLGRQFACRLRLERRTESCRRRPARVQGPDRRAIRKDHAGTQLAAKVLRAAC